MFGAGIGHRQTSLTRGIWTVRRITGELHDAGTPPAKHIIRHAFVTRGPLHPNKPFHRKAPAFASFSQKCQAGALAFQRHIFFFQIFSVPPPDLSRSRGKLWKKGEDSGHLQTVKELRLDCDGDVVVMQIEQAGGIACHTGRESCFYRRFDSARHDWVVVDAVLKDPDAIYRKD